MPLEVEVEAITDPTSRIITPAVISAYIEAAGDFGEAVSGSYTSPVCCTLTHRYSCLTASCVLANRSCGVCCILRALPLSLTASY